MNNNDDVGYEINYESAQELCGDSAVNAAMGNNNYTTEDSAGNNNIHLGYKGDEGKSKIGVDDTHPTILVPLLFWQIKMNGLVVVQDFYSGPQESWR
jgi:hypothetical protein